MNMLFHTGLYFTVSDQSQIAKNMSVCYENLFISKNHIVPKHQI